ncbi:MAG: ABC transporter permease subunit, partial [Holophagales bacterium]|nr:ABC transporter permease subunit [Holophagales bacterium]
MAEKPKPSREPQSAPGGFGLPGAEIDAPGTPVSAPEGPRTLVLNEILAVFRKEMIDSVRDRRSLVSALAFAVFGPLLVALLLGALAERQVSEDGIEIPIAGAERAPSLVRFLEQQGASIVDPPPDPERAIRDGGVYFVVRIDPDYPEAMRRSSPGAVEILHDSSRMSGDSQRQKVIAWIQAWGSEVADLRLLSRGVDPAVTRPISVRMLDFASEQARAARILGSLPMFFLLAAFVCGMNVAIDTTAGERERGSLESLLAHGVPRHALAFGKWATAAIFTSTGVALTLAFSIFLLRPERFEGLGVSVRFGLEEAGGVLALMMPMALMAPALQMTVAIFSRNFKEAQTYLSMMMFLPMIPGFLLLAEVLEIEEWMHSVPVLAQQIQI